MGRKLKITQKKSLIGRPEKHRRTVRSLGLGRISSSVVQNDSPSIRGMIFQTKHLLDVEPLEE
ncbi:MAG: 50S ribosomal protein L30 [bacterium]|nr:50S ribosomal protein L30 [bacterium]